MDDSPKVQDGDKTYTQVQEESGHGMDAKRAKIKYRFTKYSSWNIGVEYVLVPWC